MEQIKKILYKDCKVCENNRNFDNGEQFIIKVKSRSWDNVFICDDCIETIIEAEEE